MIEPDSLMECSLSGLKWPGDKGSQAGRNTEQFLIVDTGKGIVSPTDRSPSSLVHNGSWPVFSETPNFEILKEFF